MSTFQGTLPSPQSPSLPPPPGITPNFHEPYSLDPYQQIEIVACVLITTITLIGRIYTKLALIKHFTWEDCISLRVNLLSQIMGTSVLILPQTPRPWAGYVRILRATTFLCNRQKFLLRSAFALIS